MAGDGSPGRAPGHDEPVKKAMHVSFYILMALLLVFLLLMVLSMTYADSLNPLSFFYTNEKNFSYYGKPVNIQILSTTPEAFKLGVNSSSFLQVGGKSVIKPDAKGQITITYANGTHEYVEGGVHDFVSSSDTSLITVSSVSSEDAGEPVVTLSSDNSSIYMHDWGDTYYFKFYGGPGSRKIYCIQSSMAGANIFHTIRIVAGNLVLDGNRTVGPGGYITLAGSLEVPGCDEMTAEIYANWLGNIVCNTIYLNNAPGSLIISKKEFKSSEADFITIRSPANYRLLLNYYSGACTIGFRASSINFRDYEYIRQPVKLFFDDGYINFILSLLSGMFVLTSKKLVIGIKAK